MRSARGCFITFEGGEGSGKSTLLKGVSLALASEGATVRETREPGGTPLAESVRSLVLSPPSGDEWSPLAQALLMNAARRDHVEKVIAPALARGDHVLCDRFSDSTLVYQGVEGVESGLLMAMQRAVTSEARPDLTFILDAPPEKLLSRRASRGVSDVFEAKSLAFHEKVRAAFLEIGESDPGRCVVLDAGQTPDQLVEQAMQTVRERLVSV